LQLSIGIVCITTLSTIIINNVNGNDLHRDEVTVIFYFTEICGLQLNFTVYPSPSSVPTLPDTCVWL